MFLASLCLLAPSDPGVIGPALAAALDLAGPTDEVPAIAVMAERYDMQALIRSTSRLPLGERAAATRAALQPFAASSQAALMARIEELQSEGEVGFSELLWNVNAHRIQATPAAIRALAQVEGLAELRHDPVLPPELTQDVPPPSPGGPTPQPLPYATSFEGGSLPAGWEIFTTGNGQVTVSQAEAPSDGLWHAVLDSSDASAGQAVAILHLDMAQVQGAQLQLDLKTFGNNPVGQLDGLFARVDGGPIVRLHTFPTSATAYTTLTVDLGLEFLLAGLSFGADTIIAFAWDASGSAPGAGLALDAIAVTNAPPPDIPPTPNITGLQAPEVWDLGIEGQGALILNVDSGVANDHPGLAPSIWSNPGEIAGNGQDDDGNGFVDDVWGWDFGSNDNNPYDGGHGTNTAGIVIGNGANNGGERTGMAPLATMAVARISGEGDALSAYQYAITIGANAITSSHSFKWPFNPKPAYHLHRQAAEAELAAGISHANSIGNQGNSLTSYPIPWNISAPGNCPAPWKHPQEGDFGGVSSVMGCGGILLGGDALYTSSGQGPAAWEDITFYDPGYNQFQDTAYWDYPYLNGALPGLIKPDLCTYTNVKTTSGSSGYTSSFGGTSAATPHLGGALCLMISANAQAPPRQISQALQEEALDLGPPGKDQRYGAGKVQVFEAVKRILGLVTAAPHEPNPGDTVDVILSGPVGDPYFLLVGFQPGTLPTSLGFDLGLLDPVLFTQGFHTGDETPTVLSFTLFNGPVISGVELYLQLVTDDTLGSTGLLLPSLLEKVAIQ